MKLSQSQRLALQKLIKQRQTKIPWYHTSFPAQLAFLKDRSPLVAALCTRRAGKSRGVGELACKTAYENPGVSIGIIGLTRDSIKKIYFKDIIGVLDREYNLGMVINKTELSVTFPNGAVIYFAGADATEEEMNKFLGQKYKLVIIDEASMYKNIDIEVLIHEILEPAVADYRGQIIAIGTPSNFLDTYYHKITTGKVKGWSVHKWTCYDNPHVAEQVKEFTERAKERNPDIEQDPGYRQHWLGEWVVDLGSRIYKFNPNLNAKSIQLSSGYQYVLGIDLGYEDDTAFVVGAWSHYDQALHIVHVESEPHLILLDDPEDLERDSVEKRIMRLYNKFGFGTIVMDGAGKQGIETLQTRIKHALQRADKTDKKDFIELMNSDFLLRRINVNPETCGPLIDEWSKLVWDADAKKKGDWKEDRSCKNHCADAALYMWRWCYHYAAIPKDAPPTVEKQIEQDLIQRDTQEYEQAEAIYDNSDFFG